MVGKKGMGWITPNPTEAQGTILKKHCRISEVFQTQAKSKGWIDGEEQEIPDLVPRYDGSDSDDDSSLAKQVCKAGRYKEEVGGKGKAEDRAPLQGAVP